MPRRQPLPRLWMMTDERQGEGFWAALERLPKGAGIVFRHYGLAASERRSLFTRVRALARRRRQILLLAGAPGLALAWGADGSHGLEGLPRTGRLRSASVHDLAQMRAAERGGADLVFVSPVLPTRSHPGARPLGRRGLAALARASRLPVIALGGLNARRARFLNGAYGWAGIDAWSGA